jgi:hypothetical protein
MLEPFYIFVDVDGVFIRYQSDDGPELNPDLVANLNNLMNGWYKYQYRIVFNTSWNARSMDEMRDLFVQAGFKGHPDMLHGQTNSCAGGGNPVRQYLLDHDLVGSPFIIIDDETHNYDELWCRLIQCDGTKGFDDKAQNAANELIWKAVKPNNDRDRRIAIEHLTEECFRLAQRTPWLKPEQREKYLRRTLDLMAQCHLVEDFLTAAMLTKPPSLPPQTAPTQA